MPPYDSDSSDEEEDYSTTNVTLGYASTESTGDEISHVGGHPTWLDPSITPPAALAKCKVCNSYMSLLLQLNADLQQYFPNDERRLHILCCRKKQCSKKVGSIRAFREVRKPEPRERKEKKQYTDTRPTEAIQDLGSALFGGPPQQTASTNSTNPFSMSGSNATSTANPFSTSSTDGSSPANPFASIGSPSTLAALPPQNPVNEPSQPLTQSFAEKLKIGTEATAPEKEQKTPQEPWPSLSDCPPPYPSFYLDAYPEELEKEQSSTLPTKNGESSKTQYDAEDSGSGSNSKDDYDMTMDKTFQRFSDRIAQNPDQVLRYEFKGEPLLYSGTDDVASRFTVPHGKAGAPRGIPRCESCGSQRAFELQLAPGLIYELEKGEDLSLDEGMEWGTIIVGTCVNNCGEPGHVNFREEWVGVQWEERVMRK
jgi:pre-rRNA-processing protein TSR4